MRQSEIISSRRALVLGGAASLVASRFGLAASTGIPAIDTASIQVSRPAGVFLAAVTRAGSRLVATGEHGVIIYSDDNGANWRQARTPVNLLLTCIGFATPMVGWAAGHFGVVLGTIDGGESWTLQLNGVQVNQLTLQAAQEAVAQNSPAPAVPLALRRASVFASQGPDNPFLTMLALSPKKVIIFGAYRMAVLSEDGGKTWAECDLNIYEKYSRNIYGSTSIGGNFYLAGEDGQVFCSTDNGNIFRPVAATDDVTLFGILGAKNGSAIVYGVAGACYRSTDGLSSWTQVNLAMQDDITTGRVLGSGKIVLASETGALFVSDDNGATFNVVPGLPPSSIFDVEQAVNGALVAVGNNGAAMIAADIFTS